MFENAQLAELAIGRSTVRQRILALLMSDPGIRLHLREIQRRVGTSPGTASRELARLVAAGLIEREAEGSQVYFRVSESPIAGMLRELLLVQTEAAAPRMPARIARPRRPRLVSATPGVTLDPPATGESPDSSTAAATATSTPDSHLASPAPAPAADREPATVGATTVAAPDGSPAPPDPLALLVAARFCAAIRPLYEERLRSVYLYGARASGPAPEDSDIELLVVLDVVESYGEELERTSSVCAQLSLELGLVVSRIFVADSQWTNPGYGFAEVASAVKAAR